MSNGVTNVLMMDVCNRNIYDEQQNEQIIFVGIAVSVFCCFCFCRLCFSDCVEGTYSSEGSGSCTNCVAGKYSTANGTTANAETVCKGMYCCFCKYWVVFFLFCNRNVNNVWKQTRVFDRAWRSNKHFVDWWSYCCFLLFIFVCLLPMILWSLFVMGSFVFLSVFSLLVQYLFVNLLLGGM